MVVAMVVSKWAVVFVGGLDLYQASLLPSLPDRGSSNFSAKLGLEDHGEYLHPSHLYSPLDPHCHRSLVLCLCSGDLQSSRQ